MARHVKGVPRPAPPARAVGRARPWPKLQYVSSLRHLAESASD